MVILGSCYCYGLESLLSTSAGDEDYHELKELAVRLIVVQKFVQDVCITRYDNPQR